MIGEHTLQGRIGQAEDIGLFIASLLSEESRWINAQWIELTGGINV